MMVVNCDVKIKFDNEPTPRVFGYSLEERVEECQIREGHQPANRYLQRPYTE